VITPPTHGVLTGEFPVVTYTPESNFFGEDSCVFVASDGALVSEPATVLMVVKPVDDPPFVEDLLLVLDEDDTIALVLPATDPDGTSNSGALVFSISQEPEHGRLIGLPPNLTYLPDQDFSGLDRFSFTVSDGLFSASDGHVQLTINAINDPPQVDDLIFQASADNPVSFNLDGDDADGDALTFEILDQPLYGQISLADGGYTYNPSTSSAVIETLNYVATDGALTSNTGTISIYVGASDASLIASGQDLELNEDQSVNIPLTADYSGLQEELQFELLSRGQHGTGQLTGRQVTYQPQQDYVGDDRLIFRVNDGQGNFSIGDRKSVV